MKDINPSRSICLLEQSIFNIANKPFLYLSTLNLFEAQANMKHNEFAISTKYMDEKTKY